MCVLYEYFFLRKYFIVETTMAAQAEENSDSPNEDIQKKTKRKRKRAQKSKEAAEAENNITGNTTEHSEADDIPEEDLQEVADESEKKLLEKGEEEGDESMKLKKNKKYSRGTGIMSNVSFSSLGLSEPTLKAIQDMGFENMTQVISFVYSSVFNIFNIFEFHLVCLIDPF